jgi:hypothetical protein
MAAASLSAATMFEILGNCRYETPNRSSACGHQIRWRMGSHRHPCRRLKSHRRLPSTYRWNTGHNSDKESRCKRGNRSDEGHKISGEVGGHNAQSRRGGCCQSTIPTPSNQRAPTPVGAFWSLNVTPLVVAFTSGQPVSRRLPLVRPADQHP